MGATKTSRLEKIIRDLTSIKVWVLVGSYVALWNNKLEGVYYAAVVGVCVAGRSHDHSSWLKSPFAGPSA